MFNLYPQPLEVRGATQHPAVLGSWRSACVSDSPPAEEQKVKLCKKSYFWDSQTVSWLKTVLPHYLRVKCKEFVKVFTCFTCSAFQ